MITRLEIDTIKSDNGEFTFFFAKATKQKVGCFTVLMKKRHLSSFLKSEKVNESLKFILKVTLW